MAFHVPNGCRIRTGQLASDDSYGNNGAFEFYEIGRKVFCIASDGEGWQHVSVTIDKNRTPSWEIMNAVKQIFWDDEDCVVQYHPPKSQYVNNHPYCLHLWKPIGTQIPTPDTLLIGIK